VLVLCLFWLGEYCVLCVLCVFVCGFWRCLGIWYVVGFCVLVFVLLGFVGGFYLCPGVRALCFGVFCGFYVACVLVPIWRLVVIWVVWCVFCDFDVDVGIIHGLACFRYVGGVMFGVWVIFGNLGFADCPVCLVDFGVSLYFAEFRGVWGWYNIVFCLFLRVVIGLR